MIFLYHNVVADSAPAARSWSPLTLRLNEFRRHVGWLASRFNIVSLEEYLSLARPWTRRLAVLTFDDGLHRTIELVLPELAGRGLTATMFIPTGHLDDDQLHWFAYLDALCFEGPFERLELSGAVFTLRNEAERRQTRSALGAIARKRAKPSELVQEIRRQYPIGDTLTEEYRTARRDELRKIAGRGSLAFGAHSVSHPYLDRLDVESQFDEIAGSRTMLSEAIGYPVRYFAYPAGAYNRDSIGAAKRAGFEAAFSCVPRRQTIDSRFERARVGVYAASMSKLVAKTFGLVHTLRALGIPAG